MRSELLALGLAVSVATSAEAETPKRIGPDTSPISTSVSVPPGGQSHAVLYDLLVHFAEEDCEFETQSTNFGKHSPAMTKLEDFRLSEFF